MQIRAKLTAGPQSKDGSVCVTTGEGAGGVLATGQALYYLGPWPRPPRLPPPWWHTPSHLWIEVSEGGAVTDEMIILACLPA